MTLLALIVRCYENRILKHDFVSGLALGAIETDGATYLFHFASLSKKFFFTAMQLSQAA